MSGRLSALFSLEGRTALVTGGNSGIGLAIAHALGAQGARVVLVARREDGLRQAVAGLVANGIVADYLAADLAAVAGPGDVADRALVGNRVIDVLVNAAGINLRQPFEDVDAAAFDLHMAIHLRAPFQLVQRLAPGMAGQGWGRVINIASLQSFRAFPNSAPYGAAKGGIVQLSRAIAEAWSPRGVTCNAIAPGFFPTRLTGPVFADPELAAMHAARTMAGRNGAMEDLYGAAVFLASDASAYVTGQVLPVDGGYSSR